MWQEPKTNWKAGDAPSSDDFNRIEKNIDYTFKEAGKVNTVNNVLPDSNKNITLKPSSIGAVPVTRKVNGKMLNSDVTITAADVGISAEYITLQVGADKPFKTIQSALNSLPRLGYKRRNIQIDAGTYNEDIYVSDFFGSEILITTVGGYVYVPTVSVDNNVCRVMVHKICPTYDIIGWQISNNYDVYINSTVVDAKGDGPGLTCSATKLHVNSSTFSNRGEGIAASQGSILYLSNVHGDGNLTGIRLTNAIAFVESSNITGTTPEVVSRGQVYR